MATPATPDRRAESNAGSRRARAIGWLIVLCGAIFLLVPDIREVVFTLRARSEVDAAMQAVSVASADAEKDGAGREGSGDATDGVRAEALATADKAESSRAWLEDYNERVRKGAGPMVNDPFTFGSADQSFSATGLVELPVGVLTVESMGCEAPVYLGSTERNMLYGAGVVAGTSAPLGETSSNCVIAAHRGMFFRGVENVHVGDLVELRTIWGSFAYRAAEIRVVDPADPSAVSIREGHDLLTLVTCHPYGQNKVRIIVVCERDTSERDEAVAKAAGAASSVVGGVLGKGAVDNVADTIARGRAIDQAFVEDCGRLLGRVLIVALLGRLAVAGIRSVRSRFCQRSSSNIAT